MEQQIKSTSSSSSYQSAAAFSSAAASSSNSSHHAQEMSDNSRVPLKVLGTHGIYLATSSPFFRTRFIHSFPNKESQIAAVITALIAVIVAAVWAYQTIQGKWIENINHPTTSLSTVQLDAVPAVPGILALFHADYWFNQTAANTFNVSLSPAEGSAINPNTPEPTWIPPNPVPSNGYNFHEVWMSSRSVVSGTTVGQFVKLADYACRTQPEFPVFTYLMEFCAPTNSTAAILDNAIEWPLSFESSVDSMCIRSYGLLDDRAFCEVDSFVQNYTNLVSYNIQRYEDPYLMLSLIDVPSWRRYMEQMLQPDDQLKATFWNRPLTLAYSHRHNINTALNKRVDINGVEEWRSNLEFAGSTRLSAAVIDLAWTQFLHDNPTLAQQLNEDPNLQMNSAKPNATRKLYQEICVGASSFQIQVITESRTYGVFSFFSDLGGFFSLLSVTFVFIFPVSQTLISPRRLLFAQLYYNMKKLWTSNSTNLLQQEEDSEEPSNHETQKYSSFGQVKNEDEKDVTERRLSRLNNQFSGVPSAQQRDTAYEMAKVGLLSGHRDDSTMPTAAMLAPTQQQQ